MTLISQNTHNSLLNSETIIAVCICTSYIHVLMRDEKEGRSKVKQKNKEQHSTPKAVTFPEKNELYVCLSGLWLGWLLNLAFLSVFLKASVLCACISMYVPLSEQMSI